MKANIQPSPGFVADQIENLACQMRGRDLGLAALIYDQIELLACQLWQATGCQYGLYHQCCEQARAQLVAASPPRNGRAKKETAKLPTQRQP